MAEDGSGGLENFFPPPPPFYKHFTAKNFDRLKKLQESAQVEGDETEQEVSDSGLTKQQILNLPSELRYLIPPELPADGRYRSFGEWQDVSTSEQAIHSSSLTCLQDQPP
jgi:mediator of RNA polymerase II transcription subunit 7